MQRSGTSILFRALRECGLPGFNEGHLWDEVVEALSRIRDVTYPPAHTLKQDLFCFGEGRDRVFEQVITRAIDEFHREVLGTTSGRWFDKSPGVHPIETLPMVLQLFPEARVLFVYRNGISVIDSANRLWGGGRPDGFASLCIAWERTMSTWRRLRPLVADRSIEISQEQIAGAPDEVAHEIAEALGAPSFVSPIERTFAQVRENSAFPERSVGDYDHAVAWSADEKRFFSAACGAEMAAWGFEEDFDRPRGAERPIAAAHHEAIDDYGLYHRWLRELRQPSTPVGRGEAVASEPRVEGLASKSWRRFFGRSP